MPTYAVVDRFFESNAIAAVVRGAFADRLRMVIVGADAIDDAALHLAETVLRVDELDHADTQAIRTFTIFQDNTVRLQTVDQTGAEILTWRQAGLLPDTGANNMRRIRRLAAASPPEAILGVGVVRVASGPGTPEWEAMAQWIEAYNTRVCLVAADLLREDPSLIERARALLKEAASPTASSVGDTLMTWNRILHNGSDAEVVSTVLKVLQSTGRAMSDLRRTAPFLGMVPAVKREAIFRALEED